MSIADNYGDEDDDNVGDDTNDDGDGDDVVIRMLCPVLEKCKDDKGNLHRLGDTYIGETTIYSNFKYLEFLLQEWTVAAHVNALGALGVALGASPPAQSTF